MYQVLRMELWILSAWYQLVRISVNTIILMSILYNVLIYMYVTRKCLGFFIL